jgi:hypothetical protein
MLRTIKDENISTHRHCSNNIWILRLVSSAIDFSFMNNFLSNRNATFKSIKSSEFCRLANIKRDCCPLDLHHNWQVLCWRWEAAHLRFEGNFGRLQKCACRSKVDGWNSLCQAFFPVSQTSRGEIRLFVWEPLSGQCWPFKSVCDNNVVKKRANMLVTKS